jgi:F-type H+-transporting ATPase subunit gamma
MQTIEQLRDSIESAEGLQQVVKTMKGLAAVNIRQYQRASDSLDEYADTIELGLHILLTREADVLRLRGDVTAATGPILAVVFGSDQGMVGQFNSRIARHYVEQMDELGVEPERRWILAIGRRLAGRVRSEDGELIETHDLPRSADAIAMHVSELLPVVQDLRAHGAVRVVLLHHLPASGASYHPTTRHVFPVSIDWLEELRRTPWPGRCLPTFRIPPEDMLAHLVEQQLFVSLQGALAGSLAAENASRLASMQAAEKNIEERLGNLRHLYHRRRQSEITSELLDVMAGFEAARED